MTVNSDALDKVREYFEGKEALYLEKGARVVRVGNIRMMGHKSRHPDYPGSARIEADVEEIATAGLPVWAWRVAEEPWTRNRQWGIATDLPRYPYCSSDRWLGGVYAGWEMHFSSDVIAAVREMAAGFPVGDDSGFGLWQIRRYIGKWQREAMQAVLLKLASEKAEREAARLQRHGQRLVERLGAAIDAGDASGVAAGDVFARVRKGLKLPERRRLGRGSQKNTD